MISYYGLDFETSGTDPWGSAVPIQIGIAGRDGFDVEYLIGGWDWNEYEWNEQSETIHHISRDELQAAAPVWQVDIIAASELLRHRSSSRMFTVIVGWNVAGFDRQFITRWMPNLNRCLSYRTVDLNAIVFALADDEAGYERIKKASKRYAADELSKFGMEENWHSALYDAQAALCSFEYLKGLDGAKHVLYATPGMSLID